MFILASPSLSLQLFLSFLFSVLSNLHFASSELFRIFEEQKKETLMASSKGFKEPGERSLLGIITRYSLLRILKKRKFSKFADLDPEIPDVNECASPI